MKHAVCSKADSNSKCTINLNKFHIKLFQICEAETGYVSGFEIYTGKNSSKSVRVAQKFEPGCSKTTKLVIGLLQ